MHLRDPCTCIITRYCHFSISRWRPESDIYDCSVGNRHLCILTNLPSKILWVSWTAKKTNEWVLNKAGVKKKLLDTVKAKAKKLAYYGHTIRKQGNCLEREIMQGTMPGARRRGRPRTAWMDNIKTWTGLSVEESIRMTEDRDK